MAMLELDGGASGRRPERRAVMARITIPSLDSAPEKARPALDKVKGMFGSVPNLFRILANSPAALEGYLALSSALAGGSFDLATRERIALAVAEVNGCTYCLSAHSYIGTHMARMSERDLALARDGRAEDGRADAAVKLAVAIARGRGRVGAEEIAAAREAGLSEAAVLEVLAHVALNVLTNYVNIALETEVDFPVVEARRAA
jgi:uncharacterized peroxidase-related enzyme